MAEYMNCGTEDQRSDFFAFNDYSWCDPSSFTQSGWDEKVKKFSGYGQPIFLSEYGCIKNKRDFGEVEALYSEKMTSVYSGGLVYEYSQEDSKYGITKLSGGKVEELPDFKALANAFKSTPNPDGDGGYNKTAGGNPCPAKNAPNWDVDSGDVLPAIPEPAKKYMKDGAGKAKGFSGSGSQDAGTKSTGTAAPGSASVPSDGSSSGSGSGSSSTSSSSSESSGAAAGLQVPALGFAPLFVGTITILSGLFGASLILV